MRRIVSLLPSATEIVYALGLEDDLVAVTFECNEPPRARTDKRIVVGGLDTRSMSPGEIDRYVRGRLAVDGDLYTLHADALADLDPDLVLTQDLCRVCAVPTGHVREALDHLGCRAQVVTLDPQTLSQVLDSVLDVARAAGVPDRGRRLVDDLERRLGAVAHAVAARPRPRVAVIEWVDPPFGAGHWIPDQVRAAGGDPVACRPGRRSVPTTWESIAAERPDVVVVAPCGFDLDGAVDQGSVVVEQLAGLLPGARFWAMDGDAFVVRPGPRLVDGVETLATLLHPGPTGRHGVPDPAAARRLDVRQPAAASSSVDAASSEG